MRKIILDSRLLTSYHMARGSDLGRVEKDVFRCVARAVVDQVATHDIHCFDLGFDGFNVVQFFLNCILRSLLTGLLYELPL